MPSPSILLPKNTFAPLYVVGIGPGHTDHLTPEALACLQKSDVICGYTGYISQVDPQLLAEKKVISTGMMGEIERTQAALEQAKSGKSTSIVCSGDPGVYALAGLALELIEQQGYAACDFPLHVVPGVPAVCAAAALLGAPLTHDFACISLSDLLTPWVRITKRLECAFDGDFVTVLYNPRSKRRAKHLDEALTIGLRYRTKETPVGIVRNAMRPDQSATVTTLNTVDVTTVDMFTLLIIGNTSSRIVPGRGSTPLSWEHGARILTPRGYAEKYGKN